MQHRGLFAVLSLLAIGSLACGPLQAMLATPTPTPTSTPTPTATPTITPTPTATRTPLPTATPTPALGVDASGVVIRQSDLPAGFVEIPSEEIAPSTEPAVAGCEYGCDIQALSTFMNPESLEIVVGMTVLLTTTMDQVGFDTAMLNPEVAGEGFMMGLAMAAPENVEPMEYGELPGVENIGERSGGITAVIDYQVFVMRMDMIMLRRGQIGVLVIVMYPEGEQHSVSVYDMARLLDERAVEALQYQQ